jgi:signal transduction histidine kinase
MAVWATAFYFIIIDEINDETDDTLEDYSEHIITRALAGEELPSVDNGTNNTYYICEVNREHAIEHEGVRYSEDMIYIESKGETEPARILKTIFRDSLNRYYELTVAIPTIEKEDLQETILSWIVTLYLILLFVIIGLNAWILYRSFKPMYSLLRWLDRFSVGKQLEPLNNDAKITEFRKLNDAVLRSARRNVEVYEQQKVFIGHASHEMQTPLAICQNRLELLVNNADVTESQLEEIIKIKHTLDHIIKLNKTLLLLTKIENDQFPDQKEIVVNDLLKKLIDDYSEVYTYQNISVSFIENAVVKVRMNDVLASVLFGNLLKNAFAHNHKDGRVEVLITSNGVEFSNTAELGELDSSQIFTRFYQGAKKEGFTGLGLTLAASICKLYGIGIRYNYKEKEHHFNLTVPKI